MPLPSLMSRARPTKLAMAPISERPRLIAPTSAPRSKASVCTRIFIASASGHRRKNRDFGVFRQGGVERDDVLIDRHPERLAGCQFFRPHATARLQLRDQI